MAAAPAQVVVEDRPLGPQWKWVGGKRWIAARLAELIQLRLAGDLKRMYYEPFLGAGAVMLQLPAETPKTIGDFCEPLVNLWDWIGRDPAALHRMVTNPNWKNEEDSYYAIRDSFNRGGKVSRSDSAPAARMLWLNAACFNGIYRENKDGFFNVPFGKRKTLTLPTLESLLVVRGKLMNARLGCWDFAQTIEDARKNDVIYLDPPYDVPEPDERASSGEAKAFVDYVGGGFGPEEQTRLANAAETARAAGAFVMISNADTRHVRAIFPETRWLIEPIAEKRSVAADGAKRAPAACLLITSR